MCNSEASELTDSDPIFANSPTTHTPIVYNNPALLKKCFNAGLNKVVRKDEHIIMSLYTDYIDSENERKKDFEDSEDPEKDKVKKTKEKEEKEKEEKEKEKKEKNALRLQRCFLVGAYVCEQRRTGKDALLGKCLAAGLFKQ